MRYIPIVTSDGNPTMLTAAKLAKSPSPLRVLLVGNKEEDFFVIREILERNRQHMAAVLDHTHSLDEAREMLHQKPYDLVLFEHETGDADAVRLASEFLHAGISLPFIQLSADADDTNI